MSLSRCLFTSLEQSHATRHSGKEGGGWGGPEGKEETEGQLGLGAGCPDLRVLHSEVQGLPGLYILSWGPGGPAGEVTEGQLFTKHPKGFLQLVLFTTPDLVL